MEFELKQLLTKTPQGVKATRNGEGLSPKSHAVLKSLDATKSVSELKKLCVGPSLTEADFEAALKELGKFEYLRVVDAAAEASAKAEAEAERMMLMTLDFTAVTKAAAAKALAPAVAKPAASAAPRPAAKVPAIPAPAPAPAPAKAAPPAAAVSAEEQAREDKAARLKLAACLT